MMKYITLLITLFTTPFLIQGMDKPEYQIPQAIVTHKNDVQKLCTNTYLMLHNFKSNQKTSISKLIKVIEITQSLKLSSPPITEQEMGFFIYKTNPKLDWADSIRTPFSHVPNNIKASVFFIHLYQYHENLNAKTLVSPNETTAFNYFKQQKTEALVTKNAERRLIIPAQTVKEIIIPAPDSVGVKEFTTFADLIENFLKDSPKDMLGTIKLFYHNELNKQNL